jgi:diaminopimelate epimerase
VPLKFVKMHGIGNDYVYLDAATEPALESRFDGNRGRDLVRRMSDRHTGIGSDGVILVCRPTGATRGAEPPADVRMRMFNADGTEAEMCGNGIRCVAKFARDRLALRSKPMRVETGRGVLSIDYRLVQGRLVEATVDMGEPILAPARLPVEFPRPAPSAGVIGFPIADVIPWPAPAAWMEDCKIDNRMTCVSMGNPHVVVFCGHVQSVPLHTIGPLFEQQPIFPERINAHFAQVVSPTQVRMRTWERGAGATLACGTGACAVLVAGVLTRRLERDALIHLPGGDLRARWDEATNHVFMTGPADDVFEGVWPD